VPPKYVFGSQLDRRRTNEESITLKSKGTNMKLYQSLFAGMLIFSSAAVASDDTTKERLQETTTVLNEIMSAPDQNIPEELLHQANCIVIIPNAKSGAFVVGGKYGRGYVVCRRPHNLGWGAPASVRMEGGSFGFQIGGAETDLVLLVMNRRGMDRLLESRFTLGGAAEVAVGPVGRSSTAQTDAKMTAQILSYSRSRGVFAGISLQGATLRQDLDENNRLYGRRYSNKTILRGKIQLEVPRDAGELVSMLNRYSQAESSN
jgi:SH3 domain-containing YSC84-like protein 1